MLEACGVTRVVQSGEPPVARQLFADVSLRVAPGEILFVVGALRASRMPACSRA
jgi:hypothetical protein